MRLGDDPRVAGEDAVDVGEDLARIGAERAGERDRGQIRAAAPERGGFAFRRLALEPGHDDDVVIRRAAPGFAAG